jgi:hypothetical protein
LIHGTFYASQQYYGGGIMRADEFVFRAMQGAQIFEALSDARYMLIAHHKATIECDGERWQTDFAHEIDRLTDAMQALCSGDVVPIDAPVNGPGLVTK